MRVRYKLMLKHAVDQNPAPEGSQGCLMLLTTPPPPKCTHPQATHPPGILGLSFDSPFPYLSTHTVYQHKIQLLFFTGGGGGGRYGHIDTNGYKRTILILLFERSKKIEKLLDEQPTCHCQTHIDWPSAVG